MSQGWTPPDDAVLQDWTPPSDAVLQDTGNEPEISTIKLDQKEAEKNLVEPKNKRQLDILKTKSDQILSTPFFQDPKNRAAFYEKISSRYSDDELNYLIGDDVLGRPATQNFLNTLNSVDRAIAEQGLAKGDEGVLNQFGAKMDAITEGLKVAGNPLPEIAYKSVKSVPQGTQAGMQKIGETGAIKRKEGIPEAVLNATVGTVQTALSAGAAVIPVLAGFTVGTQAAESAGGGAAVETVMSPVEKFVTNPIIEKYHKEGKEPPSWIGNIGSLADLAWNIVLFAGGQKAISKFREGKATPEDVKSVIEETPPEKIQEAIDATYSKPEQQVFTLDEASQKLSKDLFDAPDEVKPIIEQKLQETNGKLEEAQNAVADEQLTESHNEAITQKQERLRQSAEGLSEESKLAIDETIKNLENEKTKITTEAEKEIGKKEVLVSESEAAEVVGASEPLTKTPEEIVGIAEADKIAQDQGFRNRSELLGSVKKHTGEEVPKVQDVKLGALEKVKQQRAEAEKNIQSKTINEKPETITPKTETITPEPETKAAVEETKIEKPDKFITSLREKAEKLKELNRKISPTLPEGTKTLGMDFDTLVDGAVKVIEETYKAGKNIKEAIEKYISETKAKWGDVDYPEKGIRALMEETEKELTSITHKETAKEREAAGMESYEKTTKSRETLEAEADKAMEDGVNVEKILSKIKKGEVPTDVENVILERYKGALEKEIEKNPTAELVKKRQDFIRDTDVAGTIAGRALQSRQNLAEKADNLANFLSDTQEAQGVPLTESQIKIEQAKYEELKSAKEAYDKGLAEQEEKIKGLEKENAKLKAEREYKKQQRTFAGTRRKTSVEYSTERKAIVNSAREKLQAIRASGQAAIVPYARELAAIAPEIGKMVKSLAEEGVQKFDDVVNIVHDEFKDLITDLKKSDIIDVLEGKYNEKKQTRSEIAEKVREWKAEAKLLNELHKEKTGYQPKSEKEQRAKSRRVQELEEAIKKVRGKKESESSAWLSEEAKIKQERERLIKAIEKGEKDIREGNHLKEKSQAPEIPLTKENRQLLDRYIEVKKKIENDREALRREKLAGWEKAYNKVMEFAGLRRIISTAFDASIPFRQAVVISLNPRHYIPHRVDGKLRQGAATKAWEGLFKNVFNQKRYDRTMFEIKNDKEYHADVKDGIHYNELESLDPQKRNEDYQRSFLYKIPGAKEPLFATQRVADSFLNIARYELFQKQKRVLEQAGYTRQSHPEVYKAMAKWTMNVTGRGNMLKAIEDSHNARVVLGNTFFGQRLMASRFNLLNPVYYAKMPKEVRIEAFKDMAGFATTAVVTALALKSAGADVSLDWDNSDFLKMKFGNKRYDITGGMAIYLRTYFRLGNAVVNVFNPNDSKQEAKDDIKYAKYAGMSALNFFRYKLAPNTAYAWDAVAQQNAIGEPFDPYDILRFYPMYAEEFIEGLKREGGIATATVLLPQLFGFGYQEYPEKPSKGTTSKTNNPFDGSTGFGEGTGGFK